MTTLLQETIDCIQWNGKKIEDVLFIKDYTWYNTFNYFIENANETYDDWYWSQEVNGALMIVWKDFWLERHEYDGSEWWEFKEQPKQPKNKSNVKIFNKYEDEY